MHLYPVVKRFIVAGVCAVALLAHAADAIAQVAPNSNNMAVALSSQPGNTGRAATMSRGATPYIPSGRTAGQLAEEQQLTQAELDRLRANPNSKEAKAFLLAKEAQENIGLFGRLPPEVEINELDSTMPPPPNKDTLQDVHKTYGTRYGVSDDLINEEVALDMRRDAQREAALSYGARGGLSKRSYQIMERLSGYEGVLDKVFDFRQLLVKAPSGLLIEPPIVRESLDTMVITDNGNEAAVADQVLKINRQAKIVPTARNWRQYLVMAYESQITPPPRVLWPKNREEQLSWNAWVAEGWDAGYLQGEEIFNSSLNQLVSDYRGMVRYRMLLAQGKISQPYALHEDRGVTGGRSEMRVGDRALRITGPSQFLTGGDLWKPADR
jgi:defect-in-organelle-trafficking protein DotC